MFVARNIFVLLYGYEFTQGEQWNIGHTSIKPTEINAQKWAESLVESIWEWSQLGLRPSTWKGTQWKGTKHICKAQSASTKVNLLCHQNVREAKDPRQQANV